MKTNVSIELTDEQRNALAVAIDGKQSKRLATRAELGALCRLFVEAVIEHEAEQAPCQPGRLFSEPVEASEPRGSLHIADAEDRASLAGKPVGYVVGWNKVKRRLGAHN